MFALLSGLIFLSLVLAGYAIFMFVYTREEAQAVHTRRLATMTGGTNPVVETSILRDQRLSSIGFVNTMLGRISLTAPLLKLVRQARFRRRPGEVVLLMLLFAYGGFIVMRTAIGPGPFGLIFSVIAGLMASALPVLWVQRIRDKRVGLFGEQLADALDLIRAALQAGHGFLSSLSVVADEFPDPIATEFREMAEEMRLGMPMRDAFHALIDRVPDPNLPIMAVGVLVAHEVGGNMAEVLDNISHTIRERFKLQRETQVMTAQGRLSGLVLTVLPFLLGVVMYLLNPKYAEPMWTTPTGRYLVAYAVLSIFFGHLLVRRIVHIRV